jgi:para-nitrobenzyl esterase
LSYPGSFTPISKERATELAESLVEELGCKDNPARIADVPIAEVLKAQETAPKKAAAKHHHLAPSSFLPIADDHGVAERLEEAVVNYSGGSKELMMGITSEEAAAFLHQSSLPKPIYRVAVKLAGKKVFEKPTEHLLDAMQKTGSKVYLYSFAWQSPKALLGAPHCIDLPFMFGNLDDWADAPMLEGADTEKLHQLSQRLQSAVLRFVKNGNPSSEEETWPEYCGDKEMTVIA